MPLFEYRCEKCGLKFEELIAQNKEALIVPCRVCGGDSMKQLSAFSPVVNGSLNESTDITIGREASRRWQKYYDDQSKRHEGKEIKKLDLPKDKDGKYMPVMGLGPKKEVEQRKEYVSALQEHRKDRQEKGIPQFNAAGAF
jgi:putative FmdB family regulatory protein